MRQQQSDEETARIAQLCEQATVAKESDPEPGSKACCTGIADDLIQMQDGACFGATVS